MANIQPYFSPVPISADALAADPSLANFNCWDLRVSVTGMSPTAQERFTVATLYGPLSPGTYYSPTGGGDVPVAAVMPNLNYDTYVTIPGYQPGVTDPNLLGIAGKADGYGAGTADFPRAGGQQSLLSVTWGSFDITSGNGDFAVAQLTVSKDAVGSATGFVMSNGNLTATHPFNLSFAGGMMSASGGEFALLADANHDNKVNSTDFNATAQNYNKSGTWASGDFNGDGRVNALDFSAVASNYGVNSQAPALGTVVPEPVNILALGLAAWSLKRPRLRFNRP